MTDTQIIGIDIAKRVFQLNGARADGQVTFRKTVSRVQLLSFLKKYPTCLVAMEACATAHHRGREIAALGHDVRLIPPVYVKPFVKRQKNDANDAEAIAEAASRPTMRFVPVKTVDRQAHATVFRGRGLLVEQRTQLLNALRGHLAEYGLITAEGARRTLELARRVLAERSAKLPEAVATLAELMLVQIEGLTAAIGDLDRRQDAARENVEDGAAGHSKAAHRRRHGRGQMGRASSASTKHLAWKDACLGSQKCSSRSRSPTVSGAAPRVRAGRERRAGSGR